MTWGDVFLVSLSVILGVLAALGIAAMERSDD